MKRLLEQLDSIQAIVDTVNPFQIENDPQEVARIYDLYASTYDSIELVKTLKDHLIEEICKGKPVNGYISADYGYGKTATLIYLWQQCQKHKIVAVPPFKFKELGDLMVATYGWIKTCVQPELIPQIETLYRKYGLKSQQNIAAEIAIEYKLSEDKALKIVQHLKNDTTNTDNVLNFWQETVSILRQAGFAGLAIFADESQEFLRTEEGASVRIQILSNLVKGMRALGSVPVALILSMPTTPTESAIEEQAGDIIHRMKEQKVSIRLADAYNSEFAGELWDFLCANFLEDKAQQNQLAHPATIESLGQLCARKDISNGPRTVIEVFKRIIHFAQNNQPPYTPLDLIQDYLEGKVQLYGTEQHKINNTIKTLEPLISFPKHPKGQEVIKLLAGFPSGVSETVAKEFNLLKELKKLAEDDNFYGLHIIQPTERSFALVALLQTTIPTVVDKILNRFRQQWFGEWNDAKKEEMATTIIKYEIIPLLFPVSRGGQKANFSWRYKGEWKEDRFGFFNLLTGAPERYNADFPKRSIVISVGSKNSGLMKFKPPEETHLDWRLYLSFDQKATIVPQVLTAIAGTNQVDFHLQLSRSFAGEYPTAFGLLRKVISAEQCSVCTLLSLSHYIQDWLSKNPEVSKADRSRLEHHRQECHQYAMRLLFPAISPQTWEIVGLKGVNGSESKLIESVFYQKCKALFADYKSFYNSLNPTLRKYKLLLEKIPLSVRKGRQFYQVSKEEFENLFEMASSSLPSVLAIFKQHGLMSGEKIAKRKEGNSKIKFTEHPLESFIQEKLQLQGRIQTVKTGWGQQDVKALEYSQLWKAVKLLGYLQEEFQEALEWLQRRRYIEWERSTDVVRQASLELEPDELNGQLKELRVLVSSLLETFDETLLHEINEKINEQEKILDANHESEVALDQVHRNIQSERERLEKFCLEKRSTLQKELRAIKLKLENFTRDLNASKVSQNIESHSDLEACLNDHRKTLERQVNQLDKDCQSLASSLKTNETDILELHRQLKHSQQFLSTCESTKLILEELVDGLEKWRIILNRAQMLRENLNNDPVRLMRYDDDFVDRVVTHFSNNQLDSFRQYDILQQPLVELEDEINGERRSRREAFEQILNRYEALLTLISINESPLKNRCKFDDEDRDGSYHIVKRVLWEKLQKFCEGLVSEWEQLERDFSFISQALGHDVTEFLSQLTDLKTQLSLQREKLPSALDNLTNLEEHIKELKSIFERGQVLQDKLKEIHFKRDENLQEEERQLLNAISSDNSAIAISQLPQNLPHNQEVWELLKTLYKKGHLEIMLRRRD
ncbi:hypothetical protein QUB08_08395 [Microcoleus sp. BR0-C5]|uniref:hypothetical protein n=1 Tax=Microcoleus sp. BR0-C5 TaxID=2818713 RepID=UPI002FCE9020